MTTAKWVCSLRIGAFSNHSAILWTVLTTLISALAPCFLEQSFQNYESKWGWYVSLVRVLRCKLVLIKKSNLNGLIHSSVVVAIPLRHCNCNCNSRIERYLWKLAVDQGESAQGYDFTLRTCGRFCLLATVGLNEGSTSIPAFEDGLSY